MSAPPDSTLAAERAYLAAARADLLAMRDATLALDARCGDAVSEAYLAASLYRRVLALTDDPEWALDLVSTCSDGVAAA